MTLEPTFHEFKVMAKDYFQALPTLDYDGIENGFKCLGLAYLGLRFSEHPILGAVERTSAPLVLKLATEACVRREIELDQSPIASNAEG